MKLPIDVKAVMNEAVNIDEARCVSLSVSVYIDESAPGDVQAHLRWAFASTSPHARVSLTYLDGRPFVPYTGDDMAVIVAGVSEDIGVCAEQLRLAGLPVMVVTTLPSLVAEIAAYQGHPIPAGDIIAPRTHVQESAGKIPIMRTNTTTGSSEIRDVFGALAVGVMRKSINKIGVSTGKSTSRSASGNIGAAAHKSVASDSSEEPYELDAAAAALLSERMGSWVVEACSEKRLAFALAFPFVRRPLSMESVNATAIQNAGVGFFDIIPGADLPIMTLNQAKMLLMISAAYGEELNLSRVKELAAVVGGGFACRSVARQMVAFVPILGWAIKAGIGYAGTQAMGRAAIEYYEGGALDKFSEVVGAARNKVIASAVSYAASKANISNKENTSNV